MAGDFMVDGYLILPALLGTVHSDPQGYRKIREFLRRYAPDLIFVELSPYALRYRQENARALWRTFSENFQCAARMLSLDLAAARRHTRVVEITRQITLPFEYRASAAYSVQTSTEIIPADWSEFSMQWIETWTELLSVENLQTLLRIENMPIPVSDQYKTAARAMHGLYVCPGLFPGSDTVLWQERERRIARTILDCLAHSRSERPLYIGGWMHLVAGCMFQHLRDLLGVGQAKCFLLDQCPA